MKNSIGMPRVLFVHNNLSRFVRTDLDLLSQKYQVRVLDESTRWPDPIHLVGSVQWSDLVFGWFASWHTFLPTLLAQRLKRPVILVVGGYDTANLPEIGYGNQIGGFRKWMSRIIMRRATTLIVNSDYIREEVNLARVTDPARIVRVYHGLADAPEFSREERSNWVITVGNVERANLQRKGLESFVRSAAHLPETLFVVIGAWRDGAIGYLRSIAASNVRFTGWLGDEQLCDYYQRARVYAQISQHEGFGLAVAEAMLHKCAPVVTRAGALPEVVGDAGVYVDGSGPEEVAAGIRQALAGYEDYAARARRRIQLEFPLTKRRDALWRIVGEAVGVN